MAKPIICIDFDGTIHSYERGWADGSIYGSVVPGFFEWAVKAKEHFTLAIFSSRGGTSDGILAMQQWLHAQLCEWEIKTLHEMQESGKDPGERLSLLDFSFPRVKPPAFISIDDRALTFRGQWSSPALDPENLLLFRPWLQADGSNDYIRGYCTNVSSALAEIANPPDGLRALEAAAVTIINLLLSFPPESRLTLALALGQKTIQFFERDAALRGPPAGEG